MLTQQTVSRSNSTEGFLKGNIITAPLTVLAYSVMFMK